MEKTFAHATLLSATVITAYMVLSPPTHLSAQNEVTIDDSIRVRKAVIIDIDFKENFVIVELESAQGVAIPVNMTSTTTIMLGNGNETLLPSLRVGAPVYVFGMYDKETRSIDAEKIVIRNKRITERTTLSRREIERSKYERTNKEEEAQEESVLSLGLLKIQ